MNLRAVERHQVGDAVVVGLHRGDRVDAGALGAELGLDTAHGPQLAPFYAALLGGTVEDGEPVDPSGKCQRSGGRNRTVTRRGRFRSSRFQQR
jgi:hypothetical protein